MQNACDTQAPARRGARLIRLAFGLFFLAFGLGLVPGKDIALLTFRLVDPPGDVIAAGILICGFATLVMTQRFFRLALLVLFSFFLIVSTPLNAELPIDFSGTGWADAALMSAMFFAFFIGKSPEQGNETWSRMEPPAPAGVGAASRQSRSRPLLRRTSVKLKKREEPILDRAGLNIFREEFLS